MTALSAATLCSKNPAGGSSVPSASTRRAKISCRRISEAIPSGLPRPMGRKAGQMVPRRTVSRRPKLSKRRHLTSPQPRKPPQLRKTAAKKSTAKKTGTTKTAAKKSTAKTAAKKDLLCPSHGGDSHRDEGRYEKQRPPQRVPPKHPRRRRRPRPEKRRLPERRPRRLPLRKPQLPRKPPRPKKAATKKANHVCRQEG